MKRVRFAEGTSFSEKDTGKKSKVEKSVSSEQARRAEVFFGYIKASFERRLYDVLRTELDEYTPKQKALILSVRNYAPFRWAAANGDVMGMNFIVDNMPAEARPKLVHMLCYSDYEAIRQFIQNCFCKTKAEGTTALRRGLEVFGKIDRALTTEAVVSIEESCGKKGLLEFSRKVLAAQPQQKSQSEDKVSSVGEKSSEKEAEKDGGGKEESSNKSGSKKADGPSDANDNTRNTDNDIKKESNNKNLLEQLQQQDVTPLEFKALETNNQRMQRKLEEGSLEQSREETEEIERELEELQTVKAHSVLEEADKNEEGDTDDDSPNSKYFIPDPINSGPYPRIPEEGPVKCPSPIISEPSFAGSGVVSFTITCGIFILHHGGKHLHGDVFPDFPDLVA